MGELNPIDLMCNEVFDEESIEQSVFSIGSQENYDCESRELPLSSPATISNCKRKLLSSVNVIPEMLNPNQERIQRANECTDERAPREGKRKRRRRCFTLKRKKKGTKCAIAASTSIGDVFNKIENPIMRLEYDDPLHTVLPIEIRCTILGYLAVPELLSLRVVSKQWQDTVDSITNVHVTIDGDSNDFKGKCGLSMASCVLLHFQNPCHRHLFRNSLAPECVKIKNGICYLNFEELLLQWSYLTKLDLCWKSIMKNLLFGKVAAECSSVLKKSEILPNLRCLRFELLINDNLAQRSKNRIHSNIASIVSYMYPSLKHLHIVYVGYKELNVENRYMILLMPFIGRHSSTLVSIDFSLNYATHVVYPPAHPRHILFCVPANIKVSKKKTCHSAIDNRLITTGLRKPSNSEQDHQGWMNMLNDRRKLEIAITTRFMSWSIKHLDFFVPTIKDYAKYLRIVEMMNVTMYDSGAHNTVTQVDVTVFDQCPQLSELRIYRAPIIFHEDEVDPPMELINLHKLPKSLEELTVDGFPVESIDILETLNVLENLKTFHYFQSQVPRRNMLFTNGINWEVIQVILKHQTLKFVKVHVSNQGNMNLWYEEELQNLSREFEWNTSGITPGYMNMHQITLTKL